jgi:cardiolipin synthase A/B
LKRGIEARTPHVDTTHSLLLAGLLLALHLGLQTLLVVRALLRPHREPAARVAWVAVILAVPLLGMLAYMLLGEVNLGARRAARLKGALAGLPPFARPTGVAALPQPTIPERHRHLFRLGESISGFPPVGGNRATLMADSNAAIDALTADIDGAREHVHLLFYIWLPDRNGVRVADALIRAAERGVLCRAMADDLGSSLLHRSVHWRRMADAGVRLARALPVGNPLLRALTGRIDLRNHRKIAVIDDWITYCGSQNCADPEFRIKAKYAPWVDLMVRFEGPIARQNLHLLASDWMPHVDDGIDALLRRPLRADASGLGAQAVGTGPTLRWSAMPELFEALLYNARREVVITTPYYVPDESMQAALCASARRGVATTVVFPRHNDSWVVAAASRSWYAGLLAAGVRICEYPGGLLHAKSLTLDGEVVLIGSANMDRRSFELNYENNILVYDPDLTRALRARQQVWIDASERVTAEAVAAWNWRRRLWNNAIGTLGPVL